jgi:hypothetical protein
MGYRKKAQHFGIRTESAGKNTPIFLPAPFDLAQDKLCGDYFKLTGLKRIQARLLHFRCSPLMGLHPVR